MSERDGLHPVSFHQLVKLGKALEGMSVSSVQASEALRRATRAIADEYTDRPQPYVIQEEP